MYSYNNLLLATGSYTGGMVRAFLNETFNGHCYERPENYSFRVPIRFIAARFKAGTLLSQRHIYNL